MRKRILSISVLVFALCLCACEREPLTDPVLFCEAYNRRTQNPIAEQDAYLRSENEFLLFAGKSLIRLQTNEDGAIHTAVVTGEPSEETAEAAQNTFAVLAEPFSDDVPQSVIAQCSADGPSVWSEETKRFFYAAYRDADTVTLVQCNRLLTSIPDLPSLRPSGSE